MSDLSLCAESAEALMSRELIKAIAEPSFQRIINLFYHAKLFRYRRSYHLIVIVEIIGQRAVLVLSVRQSRLLLFHINVVSVKYLICICLIACSDRQAEMTVLVKGTYVLVENSVLYAVMVAALAFFLKNNTELHSFRLIVGRIAVGDIMRNDTLFVPGCVQRLFSQIVGNTVKKSHICTNLSRRKAELNPKIETPILCYII